MSVYKKPIRRRKTGISGAIGERFLIFRLSEEHYAIPIKRIRECIALTQITSVPNTPPYFRGVMNLRGQMVSIVDLRMRLKMSKIENTRRTPIIIVEVEDLSVGVIVDAIERVMPVTPTDLLPPPVVETNVETKFIIGSIRIEEKLIFVLDVEQAVSAQLLREKMRSAGAA
jgi:purine-binding chemotaxis protein CheW